MAASLVQSTLHSYCANLFVKTLNRSYTLQATSVNVPLEKWAPPLIMESEKASVFLFPGQGSQFVGMGKQLIHIPKVQEMFQCANEIFRTNLLKICLEGPSSKLNQTIHCQPATYIVSLAAVAKLQEVDHELVQNCVAAAGFSVGEITALVFSGALTFEQGLSLVRVRSEAMQKACESQEGAMMSVFIDHDSHLTMAIEAAIAHCKMELKMKVAECQVANYLYSDCKVVAGSKPAIDFIQQHALQFNIRRVKRLPVSGAFHTPLMETAVKPVYNVLSRMNSIQPPNIPVLSAMDLSPYLTAESIKKKLGIQIVRPVRWEQTLHALYARPPGAPFPRTVEPGPGRQLGAMLRMVNRKAFERYYAIEV